MKLKIEIETGNSAFKDAGECNECIRLLRTILTVLGQWSDLRRIQGGPLLDFRGNTVGHWEITDA